MRAIALRTKGKARQHLVAVLATLDEGRPGRSRLFEAQVTAVSDSDVENFLHAILVLHHMRP